MSKLPVGPEHRYALVSPSGEIERVEGNIDPTVPTKEGWRWLPYEGVESVGADEKVVAEVGHSAVAEVAVKLSAEEVAVRDIAKRAARLRMVLANPLTGLVRSLVENGKPMRDEDWQAWIEECL